MRAFIGVLFGLVLFTIGLAGLGFALHLMMTHADPQTAWKAAAGLATFVVASLLSVAVIR